MRLPGARDKDYVGVAHVHAKRPDTFMILHTAAFLAGVHTEKVRLRSDNEQAMVMLATKGDRVQAPWVTPHELLSRVD